MLVGGPGEEGIQMIEDKLNDESVVMAQADRKKLQIELSRKERSGAFIRANGAYL